MISAEPLSFKLEELRERSPDPAYPVRVAIKKTFADHLDGPDLYALTFVATEAVNNADEATLDGTGHVEIRPIEGNAIEVETANPYDPELLPGDEKDDSENLSTAEKIDEFLAECEIAADSIELICHLRDRGRGIDSIKDYCGEENVKVKKDGRIYRIIAKLPIAAAFAG